MEQHISLSTQHNLVSAKLQQLPWHLLALHSLKHLSVLYNTTHKCVERFWWLLRLIRSSRCEFRRDNSNDARHGTHGLPSTHHPSCRHQSMYSNVQLLLRQV